jgi:hypothetical protein
VEMLKMVYVLTFSTFFLCQLKIISYLCTTKEITILLIYRRLDYEKESRENLFCYRKQT